MKPEIDLTDILFSIAGEGFADDECGCVQDTGTWNGLITKPQAFDFRTFDHENELESLTPKQLERLARSLGAGVILEEDSQGSKGWVAFRGSRQLRKAWERCQLDSVTPTDGDYTIGDRVRGGYSLGTVNGHHIGYYPTVEEAEQAIREHAAGGFWPHVWSISDHGNWSLYGRDCAAFKWHKRKGR